MKQFFLIFLFLLPGLGTAFAQDTSLIKYQRYFTGPLKEWCSSYNLFDFTKLRFTVSYNFETTNYIDEKNSDSFALNIDASFKLYEPLFIFSSKNTCAIDLYTYWLDLEMKDKQLTAAPMEEQAVVLFNYKDKVATRILFFGLQSGADEAVWVSDTQFLLCCFDRNSSDKPLPFVILGDTDRKVFWFYDVSGINCYQVKDYTKEKLKKAGIEME